MLVSYGLFSVKNIGGDSLVGEATCYWLNGPRIEPRWWAKFFPPVETGPWGPPNLQHNGYRVIPGGKGAGAWH